MLGDPAVYFPAFGVGAIACVWYGKQVIQDGREASLSLLILVLVHGYMAVIALLLIAKTLAPQIPISLEPYRQWYIILGGTAIVGYAGFGLKQQLIDWTPPAEEAE